VEKLNHLNIFGLYDYELFPPNVIQRQMKNDRMNMILQVLTAASMKMTHRPDDEGSMHL
jgi:hypothetical protein